MVLLIDHIPVNVVYIGIGLFQLKLILRVKMGLHKIIPGLPVNRQDNILVIVICLQCLEGSQYLICAPPNFSRIELEGPDHIGRIDKKNAPHTLARTGLGVHHSILIGNSIRAVHHK